MDNLKVSTAQFENKSGDKAYNLGMIRKFAAQASADGARVVCFHECSVTGYTFARHLSKEQMLGLAEYIPDGDSVQELQRIATEHNIYVMAGLFEKDINNNLYKAYVCVGRDGIVAKHRKLHPFINPHLTPGNQYTVFDIEGWKCGILICYTKRSTANCLSTTERI